MDQSVIAHLIEENHFVHPPFLPPVPNHDEFTFQMEAVIKILIVQHRSVSKVKCIVELKEISIVCQQIHKDHMKTFINIPGILICELCCGNICQSL